MLLFRWHFKNYFFFEICFLNLNRLVFPQPQCCQSFSGTRSHLSVCWFWISPICVKKVEPLTHSVCRKGSFPSREPDTKIIEYSYVSRTLSRYHQFLLRIEIGFGVHSYEENNQRISTSYQWEKKCKKKTIRKFFTSLLRTSKIKKQRL